MQRELSINSAAFDKIRGYVRPVSGMTPEVGMAAVAAELHLDIDDLELDAADAVERPWRFSSRDCPGRSNPSRADVPQREADARRGACGDLAASVRKGNEAGQLT